MASISCKNSPSSAAAGSVADIDGNVYTTVTIGTQEWTVENLRVTKLNDGTTIANGASEVAWKSVAVPAYCYYNNTANADSIKKFGALYNGYAVSTGKLAPAGWRVPTNEDFKMLEKYLIANGYNYDHIKKNNKIAKSLSGKTDWYPSKTPGFVGYEMETNNRSGFTALPGGLRLPEGRFYGVGMESGWWSTTERDSSFAFCYRILLDSFNTLNTPEHKSKGVSVRLVKG
jgi:uncharacterized protein (TIGR02145 family)